MTRVGGLAALLLAVAAGSAMAQEPSLGEAARREKAKRRAAATPGRVYTNADLETLRNAEGGRGTLNLMDGPAEGSTAGERSPAAPSARPVEPPFAPGPAEGRQPGEAEWRERASQLRSTIERAEAQVTASRSQIDSLREQLSPMAQNYVQDVNQRLQLQSELTAAEDALAQARSELEQARQGYRALQDDAQRQRVPPGWISTAS